ncbi:ectoine hydrolase DoeA [Mesorhizobium koreense]|jgi:ectoine hydrolase|uniref:ectoine hydrolase DoeA n=1 Tax=Mesorhizobium koreense TaxID=3074855 RepID=UPI00287B5EE2|nr:ectoine hydrolase DoeA [Mesorhizobium sp. WR6]
MTLSNLHFSHEEYQARLARTRKAMEKAGIDILFVEDPSNMAWLTGYDGWSFYVHQGVLVFPDEDPIWWGRGQDRNGAIRTAWIAEDRMIPYADHYVQSTERHPMQTLAEIVRSKGYGSKRLGLELENYYFSAKAYLTLQQELPNAKLVDATALVNWQRAMKSEKEIEYMGRAARIVEAMHQRIREVAEPGLRKCDIVAEILNTGVRGVDDFGGDYAAIVPLTPSGKDASAAHLTWDDRPMKSGEGTYFEIAGCYHRYHAPLSRTLFLGEPPAGMQKAEDAVLEGLEAGLNAARPGNTCGEVAKAFFDVLRKHGVEKDSRTGYPVGVSYPPDWGERTMSLRQNDTSVIKENMTFHFMPAIWTDDWGFETSETIRIRAQGPAECLADVSRELVVKR